MLEAGKLCGMRQRLTLPQPTQGEGKSQHGNTAQNNDYDCIKDQLV